MEYALIENGIVTNLVWLHPGNADEFPDAVALDGVPVCIGDTWDGEHFYRDGVRVLTDAEKAIAETEAAEAAYREGVQEA